MAKRLHKLQTFRFTYVVAEDLVAVALQRLEVRKNKRRVEEIKKSKRVPEKI